MMPDNQALVAGTGASFVSTHCCAVCSGKTTVRSPRPGRSFARRNEIKIPLLQLLPVVAWYRSDANAMSPGRHHAITAQPHITTAETAGEADMTDVPCMTNRLPTDRPTLNERYFVSFDEPGIQSILAQQSWSARTGGTADNGRPMPQRRAKRTQLRFLPSGWKNPAQCDAKLREQGLVPGWARSNNPLRFLESLLTNPGKTYAEMDRLEAPVLANQGRWTDLRWDQPLNDPNVGLRHRPRIVYDAGNGQPWPPQGIRLFGGSEDDAPAVSGRVVASPILASAAGTRTITVTFDKAVSAGPVQADVSGEGGWLPLGASDANGGRTLTFSLADGVIAAPDGLDGFDNRMPVLKLSRQDGLSVPKAVELQLDVTQLSTVLMSTDDGSAEIGERSFPFGVEPILGAGFDLVAAEWCRRAQPITVTLTPEWLDLPAKSLTSWYADYKRDGAAIIANDNAFKVQASLCGNWGSRKLNGTISIFEEGTGDNSPVAKSLEVTFSDLPANPSDSADPKAWQAWLRIELTGQDFLHQLYWKLVYEKPDINRPYTPQLKSLRIDYRCTDDQLDEQYVLTPFGHRLDDDPNLPGDLEKAPQLYLGFTGIDPGQSLSLYWRLQSPKPLNISWWYLDLSNRWRALDATVVDGTNGLFRSGIWSSVVPADAALTTRWMPAGRYWIRGVVSRTSLSAVAGSSEFPWLQGVHSNSGMAVLHDPDALDHTYFEQVVSAGAINRPVARTDGLARVEQHWPAEGARAVESEQDFLKRAATRLRHRGRVLTFADVKVLLMERYPNVYDVLSSTSLQSELNVVVIPVNGQMDNADPMRPAFNRARLVEMQTYIASLSSPWMILDLFNPLYTDVEVVCEAKFRADVNPDYARRSLWEALERRYMPWASDVNKTVTVGRDLDYYAMVAFIQQLDFVEHVTALTLNGKMESVISLGFNAFILTQSASLHSTGTNGTRP
jgi:hypothetical protein